MDLKNAKKYVLKRLEKELDPTLYYHSIEHTLDVYESVIQLARMEGVEGKELNLLLTAALYHDAGMMKGYENHEKASSVLAKNILPAYGYMPDEIRIVTGLIEVTQLPQIAKTRQEGILCDADLDYLGRKDFFIHSFQLQLEWDLYKVRQTTLKEWFDIQVHFLSAHNYFTKSAALLRNEQKQKNLNAIKDLLKIIQ